MSATHREKLKTAVSARSFRSCKAARHPSCKATCKAPTKAAVKTRDLRKPLHNATTLIPTIQPSKTLMLIKPTRICSLRGDFPLLWAILGPVNVDLTTHFQMTASPHYALFDV
jgi:hypothetical protein